MNQIRPSIGATEATVKHDIDVRDAIRGALLGLACGDALF